LGKTYREKGIGNKEAKRSVRSGKNGRKGGGKKGKPPGGGRLSMISFPIPRC